MASPAPSPTKAPPSAAVSSPTLTSAVSTVFSAPTIFVTAVGSTAVRGYSEVDSFVTHGKSLTKRENDAATMVQATVRGKQTRVKIADGKPPFGIFSCLSGRKPKKNPFGSDDDGWLCGCGPRGSKSSRIPDGGLPGVARPPSFSRREQSTDAAVAAEDKL